MKKDDATNVTIHTELQIILKYLQTFSLLNLRTFIFQQY